MSVQPSYLRPEEAPREQWRVPLGTLTELYARRRPPFRVEGLIHSALTGIVGPPYVGKSALAAHLIASGLRDLPFLGVPWDTPPDRSLLVPADPGSREEYADRLGDIGLEDDGRFAWTKRPPACAADWEELRPHYGLTPRSVVVIDNLTSLVPDTNSMREVRGLLSTVESELCAWGIAVPLLAHKSEKFGQFGPSKTPMGTTAISANLRHVVYVDKEGGRASNRVKLETQGNDCPEPLTMHLDRGAHAADFTVTSSVATGVVEEKRKAKRSAETYDQRAGFREYVVEHCQGMSRAEVQRACAQRFGLAEATFEKYLRSSGPVGSRLVYDETARSWARKAPE